MTKRNKVRCFGGALDGQSFWVESAKLIEGKKVDLTTYRPAKYDEQGNAYDDNIVDIFAQYEVALVSIQAYGYYIFVPPGKARETLPNLIDNYQPCPF